jgi:signal transduction histidine kinase
VIFIVIGIFVILVTVVISLILAHSIVHPLKDVTSAAAMMAKGNLDIRIGKDRNDEIGVLSDTLNYMVTEVQNRERIKNDFISTVSHELRTPLTSIKGWANTIIDDEFTDREILKDGLNIIVKESDRLTNMVEELLDFSRFVSGKVELYKEKTDVSVIIDYIGKHMSTRAKQENIDFTAECREIPEVEIDRNKIKQVLLNLLGNSFKFTQPGGKVCLRAFQKENKVIFQVEDNGCGISSEELPLVKEKFYKGKNSRSQTGLGLSICDEIVRLHQGELTIESQPDKGTLVTVRLPL